MTVGDAVQTIRNMLHDQETEYQKGFFWTEEEIRLALECSQMTFLNFCLKNNLLSPLQSLFREISISNPRQDFPLPQTYVEILSAWLGSYDGMEWTPAQIYTGIYAFNYLNELVDAVYIINDKMNWKKLIGGWFVYSQSPLRYLMIRSPTINFTSANSNDVLVDFPDYVYEGVIIPYAVEILGVKETINSRNFKLYQDLISSLINNTKLQIYATQTNLDVK